MKPLSLPILYSFRRCPYAMRARMALYVSGQSYALREVLLKDKPAEMLALSAKGTVPVLHLPDGRVIDESLDVMAWALSQNDPQGWLRPNDHEVAALIKHCDRDFKPHLDRYKYASRYDNADPIVHRAAGEQYLVQLEKRLHDQAHLFGPKACLADIAIAPFVRQFALADWSWFLEVPYPGVQRWLNAFIETHPFSKVMDKFDPWRPKDEEIIITP
ncbi:MAG: glutathione S-transferase [Magnetovibrio sp.]|nr:glutathione S-transferase [Magnetovibrio sp.]